MAAVMAGSYEIRTERLLLRPFTLGDVDDVFDYATSPEWGRYIAAPQPYTRGDAEEFVARSVLTTWDTQAIFAVVLEQKVIGGIDLRVEPKHEHAEIGYSIGSYYWGKGLASEGVRAVINWGFSHYGLKEIHAGIDARNERSWRMAENLGMVREGALRSYLVVHGERIDVLAYGILRQEWRG